MQTKRAPQRGTKAEAPLYFRRLREAHKRMAQIWPKIDPTSTSNASVLGSLLGRAMKVSDLDNPWLLI